ncbi:MAG: histidine phosphatase family protein [Candidatus Dadabacteria bacterium]|nr:MAG: histidine phosphatase family protein [Candidatus Dadabacteria bacterium]
MTRLYLIRHGTTEWTKSGRYSGRSDPALAEQGRIEAAALAEWLGQRGLAPVPVWTSPLIRCHETARILCDQLGWSAPQIDPRLQEIDYGQWEGRTRDDIEREQPDAFADWDADPTRRPPPGGEPVADVLARVRAVIDDARRIDRLMLVAHRTVSRVLLADLLGVPLGAYRRRLDHRPAGLTIVDLDDATGEATLRLYNFHPAASL